MSLDDELLGHCDLVKVITGGGDGDGVLFYFSAYLRRIDGSVVTPRQLEAGA